MAIQKVIFKLLLKRKIQLLGNKNNPQDQHYLADCIVIPEQMFQRHHCSRGTKYNIHKNKLNVIFLFERTNNVIKNLH